MKADKSLQQDAAPGSMVPLSGTCLRRANKTLRICHLVAVEIRETPGSDQSLKSKTLFFLIVFETETKKSEAEEVMDRVGIFTAGGIFQQHHRVCATG